ncbi:transglycosylase domain-containing protein [Lentibacillus saliphilus]|uniref:transglycosylase domain-containing protein n=1 Tax=Lentibacillus saliphilus TaxID=2737028 RepID=UPI001C2F52CA|nr:PBP1A family penicillin-binding protein [Lentibacillus saliphilus]
MTENNKSRTARRKQKKSGKKINWKKILLIGLIIGLVGFISVGGLFTYYAATAPDIDPEKLQDPFSSKFYDINGDLIGDLGTDQRTKIEFDDLPPILIDAVTATEDVRFFEHSGIDLRRIGGAIIGNIKNGFGSEGASTITQQVVENSFLSREKKIKLKVQEQWMALKLEREYDKEEILAMYLNKIFYGSNAYGVAKAAEIYFGKTDLNDLTLPEAAILAGLPQRPTAYNPYENPDLMKERMDTVLNLMVRHDKITEQQADKARQVDITSLLAGKKPQATPYEAFVQQVKEEVKAKADDADIYTDGLKIYTTLDPSIQEHVEFLLTRDGEHGIVYPEDKEDQDGNKRKFEAGLTVLDTKTGAIRAIGGAIDGVENDSWNYAISGTGRQPGSTYKPIISYAPAIEYNKLSTYHQLDDTKPYQLKGTNKTVDNWDQGFHGWVTMRTGLVQSYNVPTLHLLEEVGNGKAQAFAESLGITFHDDKMMTTDAIGGGSDVTPLTLAGAYRAFGNEGVYNEPYAVTKIVFQDGETLEFNPEPKAVMSDYTAYMVTDMLKDVIKYGTGAKINLPGVPVAGKTGTTNDAADIWFSGYTTNYTMSVWTGYAGGNDLSVDNRTIARQLFEKTMSTISKDIDTPDWSMPSSVVKVQVEKGSNPPALPSEYTPESEIVTELFVKGTEPTKTSEKYDQLDPVSELTAEYNEEQQLIDVSWAYESDEEVSFEISAAIDDGDMKRLSSTDKKSIEISNVEPGSEYAIQVVVVGEDTEAANSEPETVTVLIPEDIPEEDEENDENDGNEEIELPAVEDLTAQYLPSEANSMIDVSWTYNGPPASFEVKVSGPNSKTQIVRTEGIEITGELAPGEYTITVTPIGTDIATEDIRGPEKVTTVVIEPPNEDAGNQSE